MPWLYMHVFSYSSTKDSMVEESELETLIERILCIFIFLPRGPYFSPWWTTRSICASSIHLRPFGNRKKSGLGRRGRRKRDKVLLLDIHLYRSHRPAFPDSRSRYTFDWPICLLPVKSFVKTVRCDEYRHVEHTLLAESFSR